MSNRQIYISGALAYGARRSFYEEIGKVVEEVGYVAHVPHLYDEDPEKKKKGIYHFDREQVEKAFMVIAYVGSPSIGVGSEIQIAIDHSIPVVLMWQIGDKVTRYLSDMPNIIEKMEFEDENVALRMIKSFLEDYKKHVNPKI